VFGEALPEDDQSSRRRAENEPDQHAPQQRPFVGLGDKARNVFGDGTHTNSVIHAATPHTNGTNTRLFLGGHSPPTPSQAGETGFPQPPRRGAMFTSAVHAAAPHTNGMKQGCSWGGGRLRVGRGGGPGVLHEPVVSRSPPAAGRAGGVWPGCLAAAGGEAGRLRLPAPLHRLRPVILHTPPGPGSRQRQYSTGRGLAATSLLRGCARSSSRSRPCTRGWGKGKAQRVAPFTCAARGARPGEAGTCLPPQAERRGAATSRPSQHVRRSQSC